jgi:glyoxylase-like metal-dependent hydrolase (beta-lactamase superfamily II)
MVDTGYGIYYNDAMEMFSRYALCDDRKFFPIIVTHADTDHCGASGYFDAPVLMHHGIKSIIETNNRAYGSRSEHSVIEAFYTKMINLFSKFGTPEEVRCFPQGSGSSRGIFPIIDRVILGGSGLKFLTAWGATPLAKSSSLPRIMDSLSPQTASSNSQASQKSGPITARSLRSS